MVDDPLAGTPYKALPGAALGCGSMGVVYAAEHRRLRKQVCVKLLHESLAEHRELVERMRVEAQALASVDEHPNLLLVSDLGETPSGQPYIVTERLHGRTFLEERRVRGEIPVAEAIDLVCQALAGLGAAHAHGLVHRDIKPGNLFVCDTRSADGSRVVKVLDFGVVRLAPESPAARQVAPLAFPTQEGVAIGTPKYFAPEQAHGGAVDHRADLYAMGAVLYTLLAGRAPFDHHRGVLELFCAAVNEAPAPPSAYAMQWIPPELDRIVLCALAKAPADRFQSAEAFRAALRAVKLSPPRQRWDRTEIVAVAARAALATSDPDDAVATVELPRTPAAVPYSTTVPLARPVERGAIPAPVRRPAPTKTRQVVIRLSLGTMAACAVLFLVFTALRWCLA